MTNRMKILLTLVSVLFVANLWYWFGPLESDTTSKVSDKNRIFLVKDFAIILPAENTGASKRIRRDLFYQNVVAKKVRPKKSRAKPKIAPSVVTKTPEQILREKIEADIGNIQLVGFEAYPCHAYVFQSHEYLSY